MPPDDQQWCPFRPTADNLKDIARDVAEISAIQQKALEKNKHLTLPDRVAHQYQIAGGKVIFRAAAEMPEPLREVGIFQPGGESVGIGRISTGLGTPHIETNPDFLGLMMAFQTKEGWRVDFLAINDPTSPAVNHKDFMDVLHATGEAAGAEVPFVGDWGAYNSVNLAAEQLEFGKALKGRMGLAKAAQTLVHLTQQTLRTFHSSTAYQTYWTGIEEIGGTAGKFTFVPAQDENKPPKFRPGERHLSEEWRKRQQSGDIKFFLYWISYLDEEKTPTKVLTAPWNEQHKQLAGTITFPVTDPASEEAQLWAILASEMGANPGNWVHDKGNTIDEAATEFGSARKIAYRLSQEGRNALAPNSYRAVFETGQIASDLAEELKSRRRIKQQAHHMNQAPQAMTNLSRRQQRLLTLALILAALLIGGGIFTWNKFFREEPQLFANEDEHFKYGSLGAEGDRGIPYFLWLVLPRVFPDLMPGPGGYKSFGVVWEEGQELPVGFSKKVVGFARVTNNCAICHTATYRLREDEVPHTVIAAPAHTNNLQAMLRFLFKAAHDPRFNSDTIMNEIRLVSGNQYGNGGLTFIDRQIYRYLLIPLTKRALLDQEKTFTWMERYVSNNQPKPGWGPGRDDAMNLTKYFMTSMKEDDTVGPTDFPSVWNLGIRSGKDTAGKQMLLNWTGDTPAVRSVLIDSALGLGAPPRPWFLQRMADLDAYLSNMPPPPWPFSQTHPINAALADEGKKIYLRDCASCHEPRGERTNKVIPLAEIGTDPERTHSWSKAAAEEANRRVKEMGIDRPPMTELDPYGYLSPPLDGLWLRAPYLHNGSVPTLRDLLNPPAQRPTTFHRGYDVFDPIKVGFKEPEPALIGPKSEPKDRYFIHDVRVRAEGNGGHLYGTQLSDDDKNKLLEYLKTL